MSKLPANGVVLTMATNMKEEVEIFHEMLGVVMEAVSDTTNNEVLFTEKVAPGTIPRRWALYHVQDCCEAVTLEDICGDLHDLEGEPLRIAEVVHHSDLDGMLQVYLGNQAKATSNEVGDSIYPPHSFTWSFYKFATIKGYVTLRWYGTSNGHYSERADMIKCDEAWHQLVETVDE